MTSKTAPDVFWLQDSFKLYATNGALADLTPLIAQSKTDLSTYPAAAIDPFKVGDQQFGLPWTTISVGLFYNKKIFDDAGQSYPTESWTWADVQAAAKKLTNKSKDIYGLAAPVSGQEGYYNTIYQAGGDVISPDGKRSGFDSPEAIEGLRFWTDLVANGSSPTPAQLTDTPPSQLFGSGKLAMFYGGSWNTGTLAKSAVGKTMDVAPLPRGKTNIVDATSAANAVSATSKHPEAAWKWAEFLTTAEAQNIQASGGIVAPASTAARDAWLKSLPDYDMAVFMDQAANAKPQPASINTFAWRNQEATILTPAWEGKETVESAAAKMAAAMNEALAAEPAS